MANTKNQIPAAEVLDALSPRGPHSIEYEIAAAVGQIIGVLQQTNQLIDQASERVVASYPNGYELDGAALQREIRRVVDDKFGTDAESVVNDWEKAFAKTIAHMLATGRGIY